MVACSFTETPSVLTGIVNPSPYSKESYMGFLFCCAERQVNRMDVAKLIHLDENKHIHCSCAIIGANMGMTGMGIRQFCKENDIPITKGKVNFHDYLEKRRDKRIGEEKSLSDSARKLKAEADYKTSKARQEEMVTLQMMGELIPYEEVSESLQSTFLDIRQKLLAFPAQVKNKLYSKDPAMAVEVEGEVQKEVNALLERLADSGVAESQRRVGEKPKKRYKKRKTSVSTTTSNDGEPVG